MKKYIDADELLKRLNACKYPAEKTTMRQVTYNAAISDACRIVDALPDTDIPLWIPVTERLPEKIGNYLVTCLDGGRQIDLGDWYIDECGEGFWSCNWCDANSVIAWMPLPELYKGGEKE